MVGIVVPKVERYGDFEVHQFPNHVQRHVFHNRNTDFIAEKWLQHNVLHRPDGPAVIYANGDEEWAFNGKCHRADGPALDYRYTRLFVWFQYGRMHRLDGPARIICDRGVQHWWVDGVEIPFDIVAFFKDMGVENADDDTKRATLRLRGVL